MSAAGIRLASAQGVNERAVAEHAIALILALARQIPQARDNQTAHRWRGMISDLSKREDELGGKTLLIVGLGRIGSHLAGLARAFGMRVIATKRDVATGAGAADAAMARPAAEAIKVANRCLNRRDGIHFLLDWRAPTSPIHASVISAFTTSAREDGRPPLRLRGH